MSLLYKPKEKQTKKTQNAVMQSVIASELRIGNLITVISTKKVFDDFITDVKGYDIVRIEEKSFTNWQYKPIEITKEWLLKFGFTQNSFDDVFELGEFTIKIDELDCVFAWNNFCIDINLKYIHKLQNLFHSLTGRELTVA